MSEAEETKRLACLEVWGGNRFVSTSVELPGMDAWIYSMPADGAESVGGGDVHYVSSCAAGQLTRLLVADVAGHGASASETAHRLRKMMQFHVNFHTQTRFVRALNREFTALHRSERFATAVAFTYDSRVNRLLVCNAGHPPPLIYRQRESRWQPLHSEAGNLPLGIDDVEFEQFEAPIEAGDVVLCYTDALTEARRDEEELSQAGVIKLLSGIETKQPNRLIQTVMEALSRDGWEVRDDLTMLIFRPTGVRRPLTLRQRLMLPVRVLTWAGSVALRI
jgi:phosphoserine phosphatase RsbU/P